MSSNPEGLDPLSDVLIRDRHRLRSQFHRLRAKLPTGASDALLGGTFAGESLPPQIEAELARWRAQVETSRAAVAERAASIPSMSYDPELPITARISEIAELIRTRQTVIVCGATGSGKSTQLPKILLEAGFGRRGFIGHTQPRRLAARAVAMRLSEELGSRLGERVGFKIRFTDKTVPTTLVKLMTDGVLLAETQSDRFLDQYEALIIDEAHERSLNIDFLLAYLKRLRAKRPDLKLIITSATIDPEKFAEHFADELGPAPIIDVEGRTYPVEVRYAEVDDLADEGDSALPVAPTDGTPLTALARAIDQLCAEGPGDILVFLPTERDIRLAAKYLRGWMTMQGRLAQVELLPLYSRLSEAEQNRIFRSHSQRRIVLATNVAESSLTVPGIHYVVDTGVARISRYAPRQRVQRLPIEAISQASADQRAGRCGRLAPGVCIRLYSREDYESRSQFTTPEIRRSDLAAVLLQCATLGLGVLVELPLLDPPTPEAVRDGERTLREIGALDADGRLTPVGRQLGKLPCDPRVGRMLLAAHEQNVLNDVLVIAAALEAQDVRLRPAGHQTAADEAQQEFRDPHSDFLSLLRLWHFYERLRSSLSRSRLGKALEQKFLSLQRYREWSDIVRQLKEMLANAGYKVGAPHIPLAPLEKDPSAGGSDAQPSEWNDSVPSSASQSRRLSRGRDRRPPAAAARPAPRQRPEGYDAIHQALLTGLLSGVATLGDNRQYQGAGGLTFALWPGSGLFQRTPKWIMAAEVLETTRRYGRTLAEIDVAWVEKLAQPLLKHSYSDPHWSRKAQAAMVYRRSTLYGLPIVERRQTPLAPIDSAMARDLFITHALVQGESQCREKFLLHNQRVLAELQELAERSRRRDLLVDPFALEQFYAQRLPAEVVDLPSLRRWISQHAGTPEEQSLFLKPEDVLGHAFDEPPKDHFPDQLSVGPTRLPLSYRFHPGDPSDGVTVTVPQVALRQVSEEALGWLVPGLMEEKLLHMIRSLPKQLRRSFVPAPDVARKLAQQLAAQPHDVPFASAVCQLMSDYAGEPITPGDFEWQKLPEHLRFRVRVVDDAGKVIESSRDLPQLQAQLAAETAALEPQSGTGGLPEEWNGRRVTRLEELPRIPDSVTLTRGGVKVATFPALVDQNDAVALRLVDNRADAENLSRRGWLRLFAIKYRRELTNQVAHLPGLEKSSVLLARLVPAGRLREQLRDLIASIAFIENQPPLKDVSDFEARAVDAVRRISVATQDVALWLPGLAQHYHAMRLAIEAAPAPWREVAEDIEAQLADLTRDEFMSRVAWNDLKEYPRYFQAAKLRWDKLRSGGVPKDRKLREAIEQLWKRYQELNSQPSAAEHRQALQQARMLIEELRVSVFAQQLGTRQSVSVKRIGELLDTLAAKRP